MFSLTVVLSLIPYEQIHIGHKDFASYFRFTRKEYNAFDPVVKKKNKCWRWKLSGNKQIIKGFEKALAASEKSCFELTKTAG